MGSGMTFTGFSREAVQFLTDLASNNDRAWFQPRKDAYERLLKEPLEELIAELADRFAARGIPLEADPRRSPFRIYRDVRFSKDKSPYKTNLGASFPLVGASGIGGYFHLAPGEIFVGGGMWHPEPPLLAFFRTRVAADPTTIRALMAEPAFAGTFTLGGDQLKRVPAGYSPDHPAADLLRHKDVVFSRRLSDDEAFSSQLPDLIASSLAAAVPLMTYLAGQPAAAPPDRVPAGLRG